MNIVQRAKAIILNPKTEWQAIAGEEPNVNQILTGYVIPMALIPAVASIVGWLLFGAGLFRPSFLWIIVTGVIQFVVAVVAVYITALIVDALAPSFGSQKSRGRAIQLVAYSYTPSWVAGVFNIIPLLSWVPILAGLYGLYLLYLGFPLTMKTPPDKVLIYLIVVVVVVVVVSMIIGAILSALLFTLLGLHAMTAGSFG
jgi:hypothetical protein